MNWETIQWRRLALITALVERAPGHVLRRSAIVQLVYLLQVVRNVPAGYVFTLHLYGPNDPAVYGDIDYAVHLEAVQERLMAPPHAYDYEVRPGPEPDYVKGEAGSWLEEHIADIDWVLQRFAHYSLPELVLRAILIYADRDRAASGKKGPPIDLARLVQGVRPRLSLDYLTDLVRLAQAEGWLQSVVAAPDTVGFEVEKSAG